MSSLETGIGMLEGQGSAGASDPGAGTPATGAEGTATPGSTGGAPAASSGGGSAVSLASEGSGSAPATLVDASGVVGAPDPSAAPAPSGFTFAGRRWDNQQAAENAYKASFGRNWEGKFSEAQNAIAQRDAEIQALRSALSGHGGNGQGPGAARGAAAAPAVDPNAPLAERLARGGDLDFLVSLLQTGENEDPTLGVKRFTLGLADLVGKEVQQQIEGVRSQHIEPILRQRQFEQGMHTAMGAVHALASSDFPELAESNKSPEAIEHQQAFLENLKQFPPELVRDNPQFTMLATALMTRYLHGTPVGAAGNGTSGSPSARAAMASTQALGSATPNPLDGTGTPRPRLNGNETPLDRIRRENAAAPTTLKTPSGFDLGFGPVQE